ncbi:hypothetical protein EWM64_g1885 [Hericium alpestre]|uniref:Uncharacterized protein n=1 Tax=Hericium alpestre TaxID=135208 RepID=A0A4Z0A787_9AGAM|nr:hypothetical protein EWM64_g1885 [Hericium alpestre]
MHGATYFGGFALGSAALPRESAPFLSGFEEILSGPMVALRSCAASSRRRASLGGTGGSSKGPYVDVRFSLVAEGFVGGKGATPRELNDEEEVDAEWELETGKASSYEWGVRDGVDGVEDGDGKGYS